MADNDDKMKLADASQPYAPVPNHSLLLLGTVLAGLMSPFWMLLIFGDPGHFMGLIPDDAFYYLKSAENWWRVGFPSFDGINSTNGFQPLYFLLVAGLTLLPMGDASLHAVLALHLILMWATFLLLLRSLRSLPISAVLVVAALLAFPATFFFVWRSVGMEAPLLVLSSVLLVESWTSACRGRFTELGANFRFGLAASIFMLSRLDMLIPLAPFVLWAAGHVLVTGFREPKKLLVRMLSLFLLPLLLGSAYLGVNFITTGHLLPISGAVKMTFHIPFEVSWSVTTVNGLWPLQVLALSPLIVAVVGAPIAWTRFDSPLRTAWLLSALSVIFYYGYLYLIASNFFGWYLAMPSAICAWMLVQLCSVASFRLPISRIGIVVLRQFTGACVIVSLIGSTIFVNRFALDWPKSVSWHLMQIGKQVGAASETDTVIGTFDAGAIGYFSDRSVVNLDGLANSFEYFENTLKPEKFLEYFESHPIDIFLLRDAHAVNWNEVSSGTYDRAVFRKDPRIQLRQDQELFRYAIPNGFTVIAFQI